MKTISPGKKGLLLIVVVAAVCIRPTKSVFGIPDFLELGLCLNATLFDGFDPIKYQGLWFDIQSVPNEYQAAKKCNSMNYTWIGDRMVSVGKGVTEDGKKIRQMTELLEEFELREPPHPAYMTVIAEGVPESPYEVLSTDYVTYSCVHSCLEYFGFKAEFFWVFGRTPFLSSEHVDVCVDAFTAMGVDVSKMVPVPHGEFCPYTKKLDEMLEKNRKVLVNLGFQDAGSTWLTSKPEPVVPSSEAPRERNGVVEVKPRAGKPPSPNAEDETLLEDVTDSSAPLRMTNTVIPLFVLVAILLPVVVR